MKDEQLDAAIRALRAEFPGTSDNAWRTELRIVERFEGQHRRVSRWRWGLPLLAVCLGSTAWAATRPEVASTLRSWLKPIPTAPTVSEPASRKKSPVRASPATVEAEPVPAVPAEESPSAPVPKAAPERVNPAAHSSTAIEPARSADNTSPLTHYRAARRLQFEQRDCESAVKSWEAYLAAEPHGPLVLDARYHRAECLLQLGRGAEARAVLQPFADGEYGSYRRDSARELLRQP